MLYTLSTATNTLLWPSLSAGYSSLSVQSTVRNAHTSLCTKDGACAL
jgi:hypothetical protein